METLLSIEKGHSTYYVDMWLERKLDGNTVFKYRVSRDEKVLKTFKSLEDAIRYLDKRINRRGENVY